MKYLKFEHFNNLYRSINEKENTYNAELDILVNAFKKLPVEDKKIALDKFSGDELFDCVMDRI